MKLGKGWKDSRGDAMCEGMCREGREQGRVGVSEWTSLMGDVAGNSQLGQIFKVFVKSNYTL